MALAAGCLLGCGPADRPVSALGDPGSQPPANASSGGDQRGEECAAVTRAAEAGVVGPDIIIAVDHSGSMAAELEPVSDQLDGFLKHISEAKLDAQVVLLSEVSSYDALSVIVDSYPQYRQLLRPQAPKHVIVVTDDNAMAPHIADAQTFVAALTSLEPAQLGDVTVHAVCCASELGDCVQPGTVYQHLANETGGARVELANMDLWPAFDAASEEVEVAMVPLPCEYPVPVPAQGLTPDYDSVTVHFRSGSSINRDIRAVDEASACSQLKGGWYFDDAAVPTRVLLCPASCELVSSVVEGEIDIVVGCFDDSPG